MLIILEGISGVGKSTLSEKLKLVLEAEGFKVTVLRHPNVLTYYGATARKWIELKHRTTNKLLTAVINYIISYLAIEDFKYSLKKAHDFPDEVFIWERSPLSALVYNCDTQFTKDAVLSKIKGLVFPHETKWFFLLDVDYRDLLSRLKARNRDTLDANITREKLIHYNLLLTEYAGMLLKTASIRASDIINISLKWHQSPEDKISEILFFLRTHDTFNFF